MLLKDTCQRIQFLRSRANSLPEYLAFINALSTHVSPSDTTRSFHVSSSRKPTFFAEDVFIPQTSTRYLSMPKSTYGAGDQPNNAMKIVKKRSDHSLVVSPSKNKELWLHRYSLTKEPPSNITYRLNLGNLSLSPEVTLRARKKLPSAPNYWKGGYRHHVGGHDHNGFVNMDLRKNMKRDEENKDAGLSGDRISKIGLFADVVLTIGKAFAGIVSGSSAIIADAAHSLSDIALSGVTLWSLRAAREPRDKGHPYGHGRFETVGALGVSLMLVTAGGGIAWHAVDVLQGMLPAAPAIADAVLGMGAEEIFSSPVEGKGLSHGINMDNMGLALAAAVVSIGTKEGLYWATKLIGERQGSSLLLASAWHHRSDAISSVVALVGVGGAMVGMPLLDPVAALLVAGMLVRAAIPITTQSLQELVDTGVPEAVLAPIRETVLSVEGVQGCTQMRGRKMGPTVHVDAHIEVDPKLKVGAAHLIGERVRKQVQKNFPRVAELYVHIDPADEIHGPPSPQGVRDY